jgi:outer membrane immunogenic protein
MTMKRFALAIATLSAAPLLATAAGAADLTPAYEAPTYSEPAAASSDWNGAYVGVHGGLASPKLNPFASGKGVAAGAHAGYNADVGGAILGGEVEASYMGDTEIKVNGGELKERHRLAAKVKAGAPLGQTLIYGTAGLAMTNFRDNGGVSGPDGWKPGFLVGAGVEQKLTGNISARVEYNYTATNEVRSFSNGIASEKDLHDHSVKAGLNYKF